MMYNEMRRLRSLTAVHGDNQLLGNDSTVIQSGIIGTFAVCFTEVCTEGFQVTFISDHTLDTSKYIPT